jgi:hypothetical protein
MIPSTERLYYDMVDMLPSTDKKQYYRLNTGYHHKQWMAHEMLQHLKEIIASEKEIAMRQQELLESTYMGCNLRYTVNMGDSNNHSISTSK